MSNETTDAQPIQHFWVDDTNDPPTLEPLDCADFPARITKRLAAMELAHKAQIHDARSDIGAHIMRLELAIDALQRQAQAQAATIQALRGQLDACEFRLRNVETRLEQGTGDGR